MSNSSTHTSRFRLFRRLWKPAAATGAGGTAVVIWFDEIISVSQEILALILLPILAGAIYLLDIFIFKSNMPRRGDMQNINNKGANQG